MGEWGEKWWKVVKGVKSGGRGEWGKRVNRVKGVAIVVKGGKIG